MFLFLLIIILILQLFSIHSFLPVLIYSFRPRLGFLRPAESPPANRPAHPAAGRRQGSRPPHAVAGVSAPARRTARRLATGDSDRALLSARLIGRDPGGD